MIYQFVCIVKDKSNGDDDNDANDDDDLEIFLLTYVCCISSYRYFSNKSIVVVKFWKLKILKFQIQTKF